jgi:hypothetical protein
MGANNEDLFHDDLDTGGYVFKNKAVMIPVDRFEPAPLYQPRVYPGASPQESFLYLGNNIQLLGDVLDFQQLAETIAKLDCVSIAERQAVLCSGSNACPAQVRTKLSGIDGDLGVPFLLVELEGASPVFAAHVSSYGVIPATLDKVPGSSRCHLAFFTASQLERVNATEGSRYELSRLQGLRMEWNGTELRDPPLAYLSTSGVLTFDGVPARLAEYDQDSLIERVLKELGPRCSFADSEEFFSSPGASSTVLNHELRAAGIWRRHRLAHEPASL